MSQPTIEITVGIKLPGSVPFSIANAEIKKYLYDGDDFEAALDDVNDTLDYSKVYGVIAKEMAKPSALLEHVAGRMVEKLFDEFSGITEVKLTITKLNPPFGADCEGASVSLNAQR